MVDRETRNREGHRAGAGLLSRRRTGAHRRPDVARRSGITRRWTAVATVTAVVASLLLVTQVVPQLAIPAPNPEPTTVTPAAQNPTNCQGSVALTNGSFENPVLPAGTNNFNYPETQVPGWFTTASDNVIEFWRSGFLGVPAAVGNQFVELNATQRSALYQDVPSVPGTTLRWSLYHRGREGTDVMVVKLGPPAGPLTSSANISDGTTWRQVSGVYQVPAGQTTTRLQFEAISSTGGITLGNFLDGITFGTAPCLITDKTAKVVSGNSPARVGDTIEYTVTTTNGGGDRAIGVNIVHAIPANTTYVPGSLKVVSAPNENNASKTDAAGDDSAFYDAANRRVRFNVGTGATANAGGVLAPSEAVTVTFRVAVSPSAAERTITNAATINFTDPIDNSAKVSTSQDVSTPVAAAADLAISKTGPATTLAGNQISYPITVTNAGPSTATGVTVTDTLPTGLTFVSGNGNGLSCSNTNGTVSCTAPSLANGASATATIVATIAPGFSPGALTNTAAVTPTTSDYNTANNSASAVTQVSAQADLSVTKTVDPAGAAPGQQVTYTLSARNAGPSIARGVSISDNLPGGTTFVSASAGCSNTSGVVTCALGDLAPGATVSRTITVLVNSNVTAGTL